MPPCTCMHPGGNKYPPGHQGCWKEEEEEGEAGGDGGNPHGQAQVREWP